MTASSKNLPPPAALYFEAHIIVEPQAPTAWGGDPAAFATFQANLDQTLWRPFIRGELWQADLRAANLPEAERFLESACAALEMAGYTIWVKRILSCLTDSTEISEEAED